MKLFEVIGMLFLALLCIIYKIIFDTKKSDRKVFEKEIANTSIPRESINYAEVFLKHYEKLNSILSPEFGEEVNVEIELIPFMSVVGRYSVKLSGGSTSEFVRCKNEIYNAYTDKLKISSNTNISRREMLYMGVIDGSMPIRGDWCMMIPPPNLAMDGIMRCVVALGDIFLDKECVYEYENTPVFRKSSMKEMKIFSKFAEIIPDEVKKYSFEMAGMRDVHSILKPEFSTIKN